MFSQVKLEESFREEARTLFSVARLENIGWSGEFNAVDILSWMALDSFIIPRENMDGTRTSDAFNYPLCFLYRTIALISFFVFYLCSGYWPSRQRGGTARKILILGTVLRWNHSKRL